MIQKIFLILFLVWNCSPNNNPKLINGVLDLRTWDFSKSINLIGDSEFYWSTFLDPNTDFNSIEKKYIAISKAWNGKQKDFGNLPGRGFATYRFKILLPENQKELGLRILDQAHAYRLFINGKLEITNGKVGKTKEEMIPSLKTEWFYFKNQSTELELIFHVSNFHHRVGGLRYEMKMGSEEVIRKEKETKFALDIFLIGSIFIISLYHAGIYFFRKKSPSPFYFYLFCLNQLIFTLFTGERIILNFFPEILSWSSIYKIDLMYTGFAPSLFVLFFNSLYPEETNRLISKLIIFTSLLYSLFILVVDINLSSEYIIITQSCIILTLLLANYTIIRAIKNKREGAYIFLIGIILISYTAIHDLLMVRSIISSTRLIHFGLFGFLFCQAILLAKIFTRDFLRAELLTENLSESNKAFSKFVPSEFLKILNKEKIIDIKLGDQIQKEMTILFSDIRSFTTLSEKMSPHENFEFLNDYLNRIAPIIQKNNGFIDKFIGDAIMALFPESTQDALNAAIQIQYAIQEFNLERKEKGLEAIQSGIGIHSGNLILGTIGHNERMESTVISDAVNLASRIESLTKRYGVSILMSETAFSKIPNIDIYTYRILDTVYVKGRNNSVTIIEILDGQTDFVLENFKQTRSDFELGYTLFYEKDFQSALKFFHKALEKNPSDKAAGIYIERSNRFLKHGVPDDFGKFEIPGL
jgi:class 3 adenylate cyclase